LRHNFAKNHCDASVNGSSTRLKAHQVELTNQNG
jgi:hypothetical protein